MAQKNHTSSKAVAEREHSSSNAQIASLVAIILIILIAFVTFYYLSGPQISGI